MNKHLPTVLTSALLAASAFAQSTGSISGQVAGEDGRALRATVMIHFAEARGFPSPTRRTMTDGYGKFTFSQLESGRYTICAQVSEVEPAPAESPWVDTCDWPTPLPPVTLADGQHATGIRFTSPKGVLLELRVADPESVLPSASTHPPAPLAPELSLALRGPDGLYRHARFASADAGGRTYRIAVPLATPIELLAGSSHGVFYDAAGARLDPGTPIRIHLATPHDPAPALTLRRR